MPIKWFDFTNIPFLILISIIIAFFILLNVVIVSFVVSETIHKRFIESKKNESLTTRIFVIDIKRNKVLFFNKSNLREKKEMDLSAFYASFHANDIEKIKNWIYNICLDYKKVETYIEADVILNHGRKTYFSLLKLQKYNPTTGLIHLESYLLKYLSPTNVRGKKTRNLVGVVKRSVMAQHITKAKSIRGFTYAIRFFYMKQKVLSNDKIERFMIMTLKNEIFPFASSSKNPRTIVEANDSELLLFDMKIASKESAIQLANSIANSLKKAITVNGYFGNISFAIGVCENSLFYQDFETIVNKAEEACMSAQQTDEFVCMYQKASNSLIEINRFEEQILALMKPGHLRYLFRPIVDAEKGKILGYFEYVKGYNTPFSDFTEMSKYAAKVGKNKQLFSIVAKNIISKFANEVENSNCLLFFLVSLVDIDHMVEVLPQLIGDKKLNLVLLFNEQEIDENANHLELFNDAMKKLHSLKFKLALEMRDKNLLLDESIYTNFDYFVAGATMLDEIKQNNRIRLSIHTLIESLLHYKKPIIATDLDGWQSIELIIKSGISKISSEALSASNDMLLPVEKKKMEKVKNMEVNFH